MRPSFSIKQYCKLFVVAFFVALSGALAPAYLYAGTEQNPEVTDPAKDLLVQVEPDSSFDIRAAWYSQDDNGNLLFYLKVRSLASVTDTVNGKGLVPNSHWFTFFNFKGKGTTKDDQFFVTLSVDTAISWEWGWTDIATGVLSSIGNVTGKILKSRNTFVWTVPASTFNSTSLATVAGRGNKNIQPGDSLTLTNAQSYLLVGVPFVGGNLQQIDTTLPGRNYIVAPYSPALISPDDIAVNINPDTTFMWASATGALYYALQVSTDANFSSPVIDQTNITDTTFHATGLGFGTKYYWRVKAVGKEGPSNYSMTYSFTTKEASSVNDRSISAVHFQLMQNYPNPFATSTEIRYELGATGTVSLSVCDINGKERAVLVRAKEQTPGFYTVPFNANTLESGIYYYTLQSENVRITRTMTITK